MHSNSSTKLGPGTSPEESALSLRHLIEARARMLSENKGLLNLRCVCMYVCMYEDA